MFCENIYNYYLYNNFDIDNNNTYIIKSPINENFYNDDKNTIGFIQRSTTNENSKNSFDINNDNEDEDENESLYEVFKKIYLNKSSHLSNKELNGSKFDCFYERRTTNIPTHEKTLINKEDNFINYTKESGNNLYIKNNNLIEENINNNSNDCLEQKNKIIFISNNKINKTSITNNNNYITESIYSTHIKKNNDLKETNNNVINNIDLSIKNKKIINNTKNMGRKKDNKNCNKKYKHNKYIPDNIRLRYKSCFFKYLIKLINNRISKCPKLKKRGTIKQLSSSIITNTKKDKTLLMLNSTAKEYLSLVITSKYKKLPKDHNKKLIEYIYKIKEISLIEILDKTIRELMTIFCSDYNKYEEFKDFKRLQYHIDNELIAKHHEDEEYIALFKDQAINFEEKYKELDGRYENR